MVALLLVGGYAYVRLSIQSAVNKTEKATGVATKEMDSLGGKKVSALDLRPLLIQRAQQIIGQSSNGLYTLSVQDLRTDVLASTVSLHGIRLEPDTAVLQKLRGEGKMPASVYAIAFDSLRVEGINLDDALTSKTMDYRLVKLFHPAITIHRYKKSSGNMTTNGEDFSQRFLKEMQKLSVAKLVVEGGTVTVRNSRGTLQRLNNVSVDMNNVLLDSITRTDKNRFLFAKEATLSFSDYKRPTPDGLYNLKIGRVTVKAPRDEVKLENFSFTSPYNRTEFVAKQKQSKELYNVSLPSVTLTGVDWWAALNDEAFIADALTASGGSLFIYLNRLLPPKNKMGNFPNQLLMKLPVDTRVRKAAINNLAFAYTEHNPLSQRSGTVELSDVDLTITNLHNRSGRGATPVVVKGTARLMKQVPVKAKFTFDMAKAKEGAFAADIRVDGFDGTLLNDFTVPLGLMKLERGTLRSAEADMKGNERGAGGRVFIPYKNLKLSLMEKDEGKKELDKKDVTSFVANLFVIKDDNPKGDNPPRKATAQYTRNPQGGFFMLVWKTILVGALKTIGAPEKLAYKTSDPAAKN